jgi:hypothetical protein
MHYKPTKAIYMKATIKSTTKIIHLNGVPARIWEGETESRVKIHCYITRVAIDKDESFYERKRFAEELQEHEPPTPEIEAIPAKLIL